MSPTSYLAALPRVEDTNYIVICLFVKNYFFSIKNELAHYDRQIIAWSVSSFRWYLPSDEDPEDAPGSKTVIDRKRKKQLY
jgi:hypothetical protein